MGWDKELVSQALGYASIACWLGAQFPQVFQNIRNQNCEGLALVFLVSWAAGDLTNLIGCYLTGQLQFQKYLAIYFVFVDSTLLAQYAWYSRKTAPLALSGHPASLHTASPIASPRLQTSATRPSYKRNPTRAASSYDELSHAASAVARAAEALASSRGRRSRSRPKGVKRKFSAPRSDDEDAGGGGAEGDGMRESVASLASDATGASSRAGGQRRSHQLKENISSSQLAAAPASSSSRGSSGPASPSDARGRPLARLADGALDAAAPPIVQAPSLSPERTRARAAHSHAPRSASRKRARPGVAASGAVARTKEGAAGLVLLSLVAVVGIRGLSGGAEIGVTMPALSTITSGRVLWADPIWAGTSAADNRLLAIPADTFPVDAHSVDDFSSSSSDHSERPTRPHHPAGPPQTWQRTVGRVSAWTCTVLYLTSRMPQIWKNFTRKSVEGLAILLFVFAFCGNSFYVASILVNPLMDAPRPRSTEYILESLPYLLGSGGTLCFDVCIVIQSLIYGEAKPLPPDAVQPWRPSSHAHHVHRHPRARIRAEAADAEAAPLLYDGSYDGSASSAAVATASAKRQRSTSTGGFVPHASTGLTGANRSRSRVRIQGDDMLGLRLGEGGESVYHHPAAEDVDAPPVNSQHPPGRERLRTLSGNVGVIHEDLESGVTLPGAQTGGKEG